jgi:hypothetical protein
MQAIQSLTSEKSTFTFPGVSLDLSIFSDPQPEDSVHFAEAAKLALQEKTYLPMRYRTFQHVDFQKNPDQMCALIQASRGTLSDIPKNLFEKLTKAGKFCKTLKLTNMIIAEGLLRRLSSIFPNVKTVRLQNVALKGSINELAFFEKMTRLSLAQSTRVIELNTDLLANVAVLDLSETNVDDDFLRKLKNCQKLEHLFLASCRKFTEAGFKEVLKIPKLTALNLFDCWQISTKAISKANRTHKHIKTNLLSYSLHAPLTPPRDPATQPLVNRMSHLTLEPPRPTVHFPKLVPR